MECAHDIVGVSQTPYIPPKCGHTLAWTTIQGIDIFPKSTQVRKTKSCWKLWLWKLRLCCSPSWYEADSDHSISSSSPSGLFVIVSTDTLLTATWHSECFVPLWDDGVDDVDNHSELSKMSWVEMIAGGKDDAWWLNNYKMAYITYCKHHIWKKWNIRKVQTIHRARLSESSKNEDSLVFMNWRDTKNVLT